MKKDFFSTQNLFAKKEIKKKFDNLRSQYKDKSDPWGLDLDKMETYINVLYPVYKKYFNVRVFGQENLNPEKPYMLVSNHTGQIAFDGMLISMATILEFSPPRIVRGMVERWMAALPFVGSFSAHAGSILGDRDNCQFLLEHGESIMVFPEGVKGIAKSTNEFYEMKKFTTGFYRLAAKNNVDIIPVAVVGAEEAYPFVYHAKDLAKKFGLPAFPITPTFPLFGLGGAVPMPTPVDIYFGEPINVDSSIEDSSPDDLINERVEEVRETIADLLNHGLKERRPFLERIGVKVKRELRKKL